MLKSLYISSFVIIDELYVDFQNGMSALTGETGAGKSIIIDALGQLCGQRASTSLIKKNASKAVIEGVFDVNESQEIYEVYKQLHIEPDDQLVVSKEILQSGKSNIKINYHNASNQALKLLMPYFVDIHSQFETQKLFTETNHLKLLDEYADQSLELLKKDYLLKYDEYREYKQELDLAIDENMSDEQLDFLQSQLNEIDEYSYTDDEVDELEKELKILQNYEKLNENIQSFEQYMDSSHGALSLLKDGLNSLEGILTYGDFQKFYDQIYNYYYEIMDAYENVMDIYHSFQFNEYRFNEIQDTLYQIHRLKRKYGLTMERIQEYRNNIQDKIEKILHRDEYIETLEKKINQCREECLKIANQIHQKRIQFAKKFEKNVLNELKDLYLDKACFEIRFTTTDLSKNGIDKIQFMISTNQGQDLSLLNETASGGEISRIMLAIKTMILKKNTIETVIFDEMDSGVSGKVASRIGEKMLSLSQYKQVICVTHLPQVASIAQYQYSIEKQTDQEETITSIHLLQNEERIQEIAKMLSNENVTNEAIENAKQLLKV